MDGVVSQLSGGGLWVVGAPEEENTGRFCLKDCNRACERGHSAGGQKDTVKEPVKTEEWALQLH